MTKPTITELEPGEIQIGSKKETYRRWNVELNTKYHYDSVPAFVLEDGKELDCTGSYCVDLKRKHGGKFVCGHVRALRNLLQLS